ncbi:MAG: hypothetical protein ACKOGI_11480 [Vulcanococcus sp.]
MLRVSLAALALATPLLSAAAPAQQAAQPTGQPAAGCPKPQPGRFAVMGTGSRGQGPASTPSAHLLEERWLPDGSLRGTVAERQGRRERSGSYTGSFTLTASCVVQLERRLPWGVERTEVVVDGRGRPLYSISRSPGAVISSRWLPMAKGSCSVGQLDGLVLSHQTGLSWQGKAWVPNAVVQREQWRGGSVEGIALMSTNGMGDTARYSGSLKLDPGSCWGSLQERDSLGVGYSYRALVVSGHKQQGARGYFYLQRDPDDLTVGWLVRD